VITATKVSSCVDCGTPIIGERLRCPACHDQHAQALVSGDEDVTLPRDRAPKSSVRESSVRDALITWIATSLILALGVVLLFIAQKGCQ
jgi:hypothetical protein